jgi:FkbM family methyltransferase
MFLSHSPTSSLITPPERVVSAGLWLNNAVRDSSADLLLIGSGCTRHRAIRVPAPGEAFLIPRDSLTVFRHDLLAICGFDERITDLTTVLLDAARRLAYDGVRVRGLPPLAGSSAHHISISSSLQAPPRSCVGVKRTLVDAEHMEVRRYLKDCTPGTFLEIGANDPVLLSQTWHLAQFGWTGVLVEPIPELADRLRLERPDSRVVQAVCSGPCSPQMMTLRVPQGTGHATVMERFADKRDKLVRTFAVPVTTADGVIEQHLGNRLDFVSIDVEGHEADVLRGLTLERWLPKLVLVEDDMVDLAPSRLLWSKGYRMLRRTQNNNWWIPRAATEKMTGHERLRMLGKFLRMPFRG